MDVVNRAQEEITCPYCDSTLKPERIGPKRYFCTVCGRTFYVPKGL